MSAAQLFAPGSYAANALSSVTGLAAIAILVLGSAILFRGRAAAVSSRFFLIALITAGWLGLHAAMYASLDAGIALIWARGAYALGALTVAAVFHFAVEYARRGRAFRIAVVLIWTACIIVAIVGAFTPFAVPRVLRHPWGYYALGRPAAALVVVGFAAIIATSMHFLWRAYRSSEGKARERAGLILLGFVLGSLAMVDYIPSTGIDLQPAGFIAMLAFSIVGAAALWRFELADITPEYAAGQILDTMKGSVVVVDMNGTIRVVNRAVETLLGYRANELRGAHIRKILKKDLNLTTGQLLNSLGVLEHAMVWRTADGSSVDVLAASSFLRSSDGDPVGVVYVASDYRERKRALEELKRSEQIHRELFENAHDLVWTHDLEGRFTSMNLAGERILGYTREELIGMPIQDVVVPEHLERAFEQTRRKLRGETETTFYELDILTKDGQRKSLELSTRLTYRDGKPAGIQGIARDVTERRKNEARYRVLFERNLAGVYRTNTNGQILDCNEACARIFGFDSPEEFVNTKAVDYYYEPSERDRLLQMLHDQGSITNTELKLRRRDGSPVWVLENVSLLDGDVLEGTIIDITERKHAQEQMEYQAYHDALTGLPNRLLFRDRVAIALAHARRSGRVSAVMFLDLDQFKLVNDTLGHTVGDRLLQAIGSRLVNCVRAEDTVARMGGDEFTILLADLIDKRGAVAVAQKVLEAVRYAVQVDQHELYVTTSIGISIFPDDGADAETLLKNADRAMYRAKELGRDNFQYATTGPYDMGDSRLALERSLHHALERDEFEVHYQPMVEIASGRVVGAEALVRWRHPQNGLMQPEEFIPVAEETQLIIPLGAWVLKTACAQMKVWHESGHDRLRVAVNLSPRQFQDQNLTATVERILVETGFPPAYLDLEITESTAMQNAELSLNILNRLKEMGIRISIDDFGTGYSSLSYLKRFPIDTVKIDQDFVRDLTPDDAAIISAVISMARALNLRIIAEGVETEEQLAFLRREQCSEIQGFLFSQPLSASEFEETLRKGGAQSAVSALR